MALRLSGLPDTLADFFSPDGASLIGPAMLGRQSATFFSIIKILEEI